MIGTAREYFDRQIQDVLVQVQILGNMVEQAMIASADALQRGDLMTSRQIYTDDQKINKKRYEIEEVILSLIATQQPMARDLRLLAAILEISTELERIADYAKGNAKINLLLGPEHSIHPSPDLIQMAALAEEMLQQALRAFLACDSQAARSIPLEDEKVDLLYSRVFHNLLQVMLADPTSIDQANYMLWAAHNLERMADRVINVCERTVYVANGEMMELDQLTSLESSLGVEKEDDR